MTPLRTAVHTIIILALLFLAGLLVPANGTPAFHGVLRILRVGYGLPFALTTACAINRQRTLLVVALALLLLVAWPLPLGALAEMTMPIAAGLLAGTALQRILTEAAPRLEPASAPAAERRPQYVPTPSDGPDQPVPGHDLRRQPGRRASIRDAYGPYGPGRQ